MLSTFSLISYPVGVQILNAVLKKYLFRSPYTRKKTNSQELVFFQRNKSLTGFVKCTSCVKYASRVKCAAAREGIYFISYCDIVAEQQGAQYFTIFARKLFHIRRKPNISLAISQILCYTNHRKAVVL